MNLEPVITALSGQLDPVSVVLGIILAALWKAYLDDRKETLVALNANTAALTALKTKLEEGAR